MWGSHSLISPQVCYQRGNSFDYNSSDTPSVPHSTALSRCYHADAKYLVRGSSLYYTRAQSYPIPLQRSKNITALPPFLCELLVRSWSIVRISTRSDGSWKSSGDAAFRHSEGICPWNWASSPFVPNVESAGWCKFKGEIKSMNWMMETVQRFQLTLLYPLASENWVICQVALFIIV